MTQNTGTTILFFVTLSLILGALLRHLLKKSAVPYTVALLITGLTMGLVQRAGLYTGSLQYFGDALQLVGDIDPHLILFLFLPTLIFESAFSMEVHLFRRTFLQIAILAVPGLLVSIILTAMLVHFCFPWNWSWPTALLFGSLISATDPVAVIALLKELSSRKRLETLLEGESLLNDGTAIVFFTLFYHLITGGGETTDVLAHFPVISFEFIWGISLGLLVGMFFGMVAIAILGRVFNDAMVEITISIAMAYSAFMVAETIFHVSGIVAVVTLALLLAGKGRTRISPEINDFLHNFWKMTAYIANTLIFLLVGIIIALQVRLDSTVAWKALFLLFAGLLVIRAISISIFLPLLGKIGIGITVKKAAVLIWGGLRGAVALTLALTIALDRRIPDEIGEQILFLTAGIVVLTLLVNGTSMRRLLKRLGLSELPPAKQATVERARIHIAEEMNTLMPQLKADGFFQGADWSRIHDTVHLKQLPAEKTSHEPRPATANELDCEFRRRLLEAERNNYWQQFQHGLLGGAAVQILVDAVERALDEEPVIAPRPALHRLWEIPSGIRWLEKIPLFHKAAITASFDRLALGYDVARGFVHAQNACIGRIEQLAPSPEAAQLVKREILRNKADTFDRIDQLRETFPEVIVALETRAACRSLLNRQRTAIGELIESGLLDKAEADRMLTGVEGQLQQLHHSPTKIEVPGPEEILNQIVWLDDVPVETKKRLLDSIETRIHTKAEILLHRGESTGTMGIVARGAVEVLQPGEEWQVVEDIAGPGAVIGVYKILTGKNDKTVRAHGPVEILWFNEQVLKNLLHSDKRLLKNLNNLYDGKYKPTTETK